MKVRSLIIIVLLLVLLLPVYALTRYFQRLCRPRESLLRLLLFLIANMVLIFGYTFLVVLIIKKLFPLA